MVESDKSLTSLFWRWVVSSSTIQMNYMHITNFAIALLLPKCTIKLTEAKHAGSRICLNLTSHIMGLVWRPSVTSRKSSVMSCHKTRVKYWLWVQIMQQCKSYKCRKQCNAAQPPPPWGNMGHPPPGVCHRDNIDCCIRFRVGSTLLGNKLCILAYARVLASQRY